MAEDKLKELVHNFIRDNKISCPETIYQQDKVIENAYEFIEALCEVYGYWERND